jgi:perosamine synthetase
MFAQKFQKLPVAEYLGWCGINLPSWPGLTRGQVNEIADLIKGFYK